jgi:hypothetical protein
MSNNVYEDEYQGIRQFVASMFPDPGQLMLTVAASQQADELARLRNSRWTEQFAIVTNLLTTEVEHAFGLAELGYADATFTFRQYLHCLPNPGALRNSILLSKELFSIAVDELPVMGFLRPRFVVNIPMRHANGEVMLVKRTLSPWQLTDKGQMAAYLSEFQLIKPYEGEPLSPRFLDVPEAVKVKFYQAVHQLFAQMAIRQNLFTVRELGLLQAYLGKPSQQRPSAKMLAGQMSLSELMIKEYNKSILTKAKGFFSDDVPFQTAYDVAIFLFKTGLLLPKNA